LILIKKTKNPPKHLNTLKYFNVRMQTTQISLTLSEPLLQASKEYSQEYGYRTIQELIIDLLRQKVIVENAARYREIEERMKKNIRVKKFNQKDALSYIRGL